MNDWPEIVIVMLTWAGPSELDIAEARLGYTRKTVATIKKHLLYPNYTWHLADDGSPEWYQDELCKIMEGETYTFSDTRKGWDMNNNWNTGMRIAFERTDIIVAWPDDRYLEKDIELEPCVQLLTECEDICYVRLTGQTPKLEGELIDRVGSKWWLLNKKSKCSHVYLCYCFLLHKRWIEHYGYFKTDLWPVNVAETTMDLHFRHTPGPAAVIPDSLWKGYIPWGTRSTWEKPKGGAFRETPPPIEERGGK